MICDYLAMSPKTFRRNLREDESFSERMRHAEAIRGVALYRMALSGSGSPYALRAILVELARRDKKAEIIGLASWGVTNSREAAARVSERV